VSDQQTIKLEPRAEIFELTLHRPEALNAINGQLLDEFERVLYSVEQDEACRVLVLTGSGRAFCAGSDLSSIAAMDSRQGFEHCRKLTALIHRLETLRVPVIAAINGACLGGGMELALGCTLRVASESAMLGLPETRIGVIPGAGGIERLGSIAGFGRAAHMVLTGEPVNAIQAHEMGLVSTVCPDGEALEAARALAKQILMGAPLAVEAAKRCLYATRGMDAVRGTEYSMHECCLLFDTKDKAEGSQAFLDKRSPKFSGQ
jgi:enoyl-CoA hydratase/carnithine racemase